MFQLVRHLWPDDGTLLEIHNKICETRTNKRKTTRPSVRCQAPFPGTDPFLENPAYWLDFHSRFVNSWCEAIADVLPPNYEASLGKRVYLIEHDPEARKLGFPDGALTHAEAGAPAGPTPTVDVAGLEPVTIPLTPGAANRLRARHRGLQRREDPGWLPPPHGLGSAAWTGARRDLDRDEPGRPRDHTHGEVPVRLVSGAP